jgi:hypothetical protein
MKNKHLVLLFLSICVGAWLYKKMPSKATSDFRNTIVHVDTSIAVQVILQTQNEKEALVFDRSDKGWMATYETQTVQILANQMDSLLQLYTNIQALKKISSDKESWNSYGVDTKQGMRVQIFGQKGRLDDFIVGKCSDTKPVFLRFSNSPEVYEIENPKICAQKINFADLRSRKTFTSIEENIEYVVIAKKEAGEDIYHQDQGTWFSTQNYHKKDATGRIRCFFEALSGLKLEKYVDDFNDMERQELFLSEITLHKNIDKNIELIKITCYKSNQDHNKYILHSSENSNNYFYANDSLVEEIFLK